MALEKTLLNILTGLMKGGRGDQWAPHTNSQEATLTVKWLPIDAS